MRHSMTAFMTAVLFTALPVMAQQAQQGAAAPKGPHPKNKEELAALQKVQAAAQSGDPDQQLAAINNVLENFTNTDYKPMLLSMGMQAAAQKNDVPLVKTWTDRTLQAEPDNIEAHVILADAVARHIRENDLDKADSISTVQTNANKALDLLKTSSTPPPGIPDAQWPNLKMQLTGESYGAIGQAAAVDKKYPDAITAYKSGIAADPADAALKARLAKAYVDNKQYDDAISTADLVIADASAQPVIKQFAQQQKDAATKMKGAAK